MVNREDAIVKKYITVMKQMLGISYQYIQPQELEEAILYSINKRYREESACVYNNYTERQTDINLYELANYLIEREPIVTAYGVIFQQHGKSPNPFAGLFHTFMTNREKNKSIMFTFPPGSEEYESYDLSQLLDKLDANALSKGCLARECQV